MYPHFLGCCSSPTLRNSHTSLAEVGAIRAEAQKKGAEALLRVMGIMWIFFQEQLFCPQTKLFKFAMRIFRHDILQRRF